MKRWIRTIVVSILMLVFVGVPIFAQDDGQAQVHAGSALVFRGKHLAEFYAAVNGMTPDERAQRAAGVLKGLADDPDFDVSNIHTVETSSSTDVVAGDQVIVSVTSEDARLARNSTSTMATDFAARIRLVLASRIEKATAEQTGWAIALTIASTIGLLALLVFICRATSYLCERIDSWRGTKIKAIKIQHAQIMSAQALGELFLSTVKISQAALIILSIVSYVLLELSFFPRTRHLASALIANATEPMFATGEKCLQYVPNLLVIVVVGFVASAVNSASKFVFQEIEQGTIKLVDFDPDWATPTYKLWRFIIICVALMVALPYLPGWNSPAFKQVGLVLGVLFSLGSTGVVANVMAGCVLTYTNAFKIGDHVCIGERTGDVEEKTLFVTRLRTTKNEIVSVPNQQVTSSQIVNYSTLAKEGRLLLHTTITIGYDAPWRTVHELMIEAGKATEGIRSEPEPFVLQTSLDDYYVSYELNVYTENSHGMPKIYSELHKNIQDTFNKGGIEIMSPHYTALRDGNRTTIPESYLDKSYDAPGFRIVPQQT